MRRCLLVLLFAGLGGCEPREYRCSIDQECPAGSGQCVSGHCAYPDSLCPSGLRFDDTAGEESDLCVDPSLVNPDGGPPPPVDAGGPD